MVGCVYKSFVPEGDYRGSGLRTKTKSAGNTICLQCALMKELHWI
ncbi:hypothetical protein CLOSYM_04209 [[Clostridium] symbiosum ATCC 14940]|uniref:Uncharacterized protein n=1 Tax=[Clostridium] symbiosum ATCC 14940 TaxID=411472 RepID=A0ABC9TSY2_CLOSY|nr:hypothetical protein CLOSYM_04209 [[Clostridium] symbiosum ATCC 14940]